MFGNLPREIQLHIFAFFPPEELCKTLAPVCRDWWELSKDPSLWRSLHISVDSEEDANNLGLADLLKRSPMLTKLKIETKFSLEDLAVASLACPKLKHLDLEGCEHVDDRILTLFLQNCPLIEELNVGDCVRVKKSVSYIVSLAQLRVLNLSRCRLVDADDIKLILEQCRYLEDVDLLGLYLITDKSICDMAQDLNSTLHRLILLGDKLTDLSIQRISLCSKLQCLWICGGKLLTDQILVYLKTLTGLKNLAFKCTTSLTRAATKEFFTGRHVYNLVHLELFSIDINDDVVFNITQNCKLLKTLNLPFCMYVTETGLQHIVKHCHNLTELDLEGSPYLTGLCLLSVPGNLSRLTYINLRHCNAVVKSVILHLAFEVAQVKLDALFKNYDL